MLTEPRLYADIQIMQDYHHDHHMSSGSFRPKSLPARLIKERSFSSPPKATGSFTSRMSTSCSGSSPIALPSLGASGVLSFTKRSTTSVTIPFPPESS
mmetsp:Transcript_58974/g.97499  ORF Transcript_58974/g.97499 Transcript_58974/m.97499 type:complete len:98 (+) Transcript_58974:69-362(+)